MIPEEDRGPAWLRDYGFTNFGDIAADIEAMEHFAQKLAADVVNSYVPHMETVSTAMAVKLPDPATTFPELVDFVQAHAAAQDATHSNVYGYANGTNHFASAAETISNEYRGTDARSHAKVKDVDRAFDKAISPQPDTMAGGDDL
jgi:hypothetical protein